MYLKQPFKEQERVVILKMKMEQNCTGSSGSSFKYSLMREGCQMEMFTSPGTTSANFTVIYMISSSITLTLHDGIFSLNTLSSIYKRKISARAYTALFTRNTGTEE